MSEPETELPETDIMPEGVVVHRDGETVVLPVLASLDEFMPVGYDGVRHLVIPRLAAEVEKLTGHVRCGPDGSLVCYQGNHYSQDGEHAVRSAGLLLLRSEYKPVHTTAVAAYFKDRERHRPLSYDPPAGNRVYCQNGVLDPIAQTLEPYTEDNAWLSCLPWDYVPDATCPKLDEFRRQVFDFPGSDGLDQHWLEIQGYGALPRNPLRKAVLLKGGGGNGKSMLLRHMNALYGQANVSTISLKSLSDGRFATSGLVGRLANVCADIGPRAAQDMSAFKQIVGQDPITAERKGRDQFSFVCGALLVFSANEFPQSPDQTQAYKNRWLVVPLDRQFTDNTAKEDELSALAGDRGEMEGLLRRSMDALKALLERREFDVPFAGQQAHDDMNRTIDRLAEFMHERTVVTAGGFVLRSELWSGFQSYCFQEGAKPGMSRTGFYGKVTPTKGIKLVHRSHGWGFAGLRLLEPVEVGMDDQLKAAVEGLGQVTLPPETVTEKLSPAPADWPQI